MPDRHVAYIVCRGGQSRSQPLGVSYKAMSSLVSSSVITIITLHEIELFGCLFSNLAKVNPLVFSFSLCSFLSVFKHCAFQIFVSWFLQHPFSFLKAFSFSSNLLLSLPLKPGLWVLSSVNSYQPLIEYPQSRLPLCYCAFHHQDFLFIPLLNFLFLYWYSHFGYTSFFFIFPSLPLRCLKILFPLQQLMTDCLLSLNSLQFPVS